MAPNNGKVSGNTKFITLVIYSIIIQDLLYEPKYFTKGNNGKDRGQLDMKDVKKPTVS